ncbi:hypothetical protein RFI_26443 [Reticulomyxa filosa]|uniref:Uncharacterized protein n=1 Tax=Reticulomyxa filosa TaxID=46433 RepID=X6MBB0_RETFI|nr:hypothetical protein RFI_26443 [Reticulomyxa filosa]|eukprot:ETO10936.1 hypothetical protein RFI_26443 [Reticulomyxa filosa]
MYHSRLFVIVLCFGLFVYGIRYFVIVFAFVCFGKTTIFLIFFLSTNKKKLNKRFSSKRIYTVKKISIESFVFIVLPESFNLYSKLDGINNEIFRNKKVQEQRTTKINKTTKSKNEKQKKTKTTKKIGRKKEIKSKSTIPSDIISTADIKSLSIMTFIYLVIHITFNHTKKGSSLFSHIQAAYGQVHTTPVIKLSSSFCDLFISFVGNFCCFFSPNARRDKEIKKKGGEDKKKGREDKKKKGKGTKWKEFSRKDTTTPRYFLNLNI